MGPPHANRSFAQVGDRPKEKPCGLRIVLAFALHLIATCSPREHQEPDHDSRGRRVSR